MKLSNLVIMSCALSVSVASAQAQDNYPDRRMSLVIPFAPGGAGDLIARIITSKMSTSFGQTVVPENRGGGGGTIGSDYVAKAAPDGYTILIGSTSSHATNSSIFKSMPYIVSRDFTPIAMVASAPHLLMVNKSLPITSVPELIAYAKQNPGKLNFGSGGKGTTTHLAGELLQSRTGVEIVHVPYKGAAQAVTGVLSGEIQMMFENLSGALPQIEGGRIRGLAVTGLKPSSLAPNLPTISQYLPGFETGVWFALFAPAKTPTAIVNKLNKEVNRILQLPDVLAQFDKMGLQAIGGSSDEAGTYIKAETTKWAEVIKAAGVVAE
jgi:tripartite-type tricarboxylate transporter receptor subunit TctC